MNVNPYTPPTASVDKPYLGAASPTGFQPVAMWSTRGRIGRLRLMANYVGSSLITGVVAGPALALLGNTLGGVVSGAIYLAMFVFLTFKLIQRSHDMNWSGWTVLLTLIPLVALIWIFKGGTPGRNDHGDPPPPNTTLVYVGAWLLPVIALVGILAAVSLPAYQQYTQRAKQQAQKNIQTPPTPERPTAR